MQIVKISDLKPHPKNDYFFDDMEGQKFKELKESIRIREEKENDSGVIEPIVITQDKVIVSGHQRVRACKELGITSIKAEIKLYDNEDAVILDLIEANIRQRGTIDGSELKQGRRIKELERIKGIKKGRPSNDENSTNGGNKFTQEDLMKELGLNKETYRRAKKLAEAPKEIQELVEKDSITSSTAIRVINTKIKDKEEQKKFAQTIIGDKKYTQKEMEEEVRKWKVKTSQLTQEKDEIARSKVKVEEKIVEVDKPETKEYIRKLEENLREKSRENKILTETNIQQAKEISQAIGDSTNYSLVSDYSERIKKLDELIDGVYKYDYMANSFNEIPIFTRIEYKKRFEAIKNLADRVLNTIRTDENTVNMNFINDDKNIIDM